MTTIRLVAAALLFICAQTAMAQQRPPEAPPRPDTTELQGELAGRPDPTRPLARPDLPKADTPAPAPDSAGFIGPPAPPRWWMLRETDDNYAACKLALTLLGAQYTEEPAVTDSADHDCGVARPLRVTAILPDLTLEGGAVMRCQTARALGFWARDFLRPAAATLPGSPRLTGLQLGTGYDCRPRIGTGSNTPKLSEHALGNSIDIAGFQFENADPLPVMPRTDSGDRAEAFQRAARGTACLFFTTVLGPGTNDAHADHLHLDLVRRKSGWRLCQ